MCCPQAISKQSPIQLTTPSSANKPNKKTRRGSKQTNRRRRPPSKQSASDESIDTLATVPSCESSLDSRLLDTSIESSSSPQRKSRRRPRTKKTPKAPKQVQITELTPQQKSQYIALDAEMVGALDSKGRQYSALARISLVDYHGEIIFDSHVRVTQPIVDYRTFVSGITASDLGDDALPILEVRRIVGELIHDKIVIGHGLKNDFKALGLSHPWHLVRDSAKYTPFMKAHPTMKGEFVPKKLKTLAFDKLGMVIQSDGEAHDPTEDAIAAMELYKKHRVKWERVVEWKLERTRGFEEMNESFEVY